MKLRFFQHQEKKEVYVEYQRYDERWVNIGAPVLQYQEAEEGVWYDIEHSSTSEEGQYDGEWPLR